MPCVAAGLLAGARRHALYVSRVCIRYIFLSPVAGVLQLLPYFGLTGLPMVLGLFAARLQLFFYPIVLFLFFLVLL